MSTQQLLAESKFLRIGDVVPDFDQNSTKGSINWYNFIEGKWSILFSHPRHRTPICTTELGELNKRYDEFVALDVKIAAVAVDTAEDNNLWAPEIAKFSGKDELSFPILADHDYKIAKLYGMVNQEHIDDKGMPLTVRSVFFISPEKKVAAIITFPANVGRNIDEIFRTLKALQLTVKFASEGKPVACPVNWTEGDRIVVPPQIPTDKALENYKNVEVIEPYLRFADAPQ